MVSASETEKASKVRKQTFEHPDPERITVSASDLVKDGKSKKGEI